MDVMEELMERLGESERRAIEVIERLDRLDSVQESLVDAGRGLGEASANISDLAVATRAAVESLNSALSAFREAVEVLHRSDPAQAREALSRIEAEQARITEDLQSTRDAVEDLAQRSIINQIFGGSRKSGKRQ